MKLEEVSQVLCEYGAAIRGDWSSIDGRSEQGSIQTFAAAMLAPEKFTAEQLREDTDICANAGGHWTEHCDDDCEAAS